jgi:CDP-4-dehydro-6-deoxyglucose reductase, E1
MSYKFPLAYNSWDHQEKEAIQNVIKDGFFTMGKRVNHFEENFSNYINSKFAVMVNSGSSANLLMIASLFYTKDNKKKLRRGDEVIVPAVSWSTSYFPLYQYGLRIRFVDIDMETLNYDLEKLKNAITDKTKVILAVNLLGNSNDFNKIDKLLENKNIILIEDNCESLGAEFENKKTGSIGLLGSFSFYFSHHISTMEGGMIVTNDEELYHILLCIRSHGWTRNLPKKNHVSKIKSENMFDESFKFVLPGYNLRPLEISGAIGLIQLKKFPEFLQKRKENALKFLEIMKKYDDLIIQKEIGNSSWFGFSIVIRPGSSRLRQNLVNTLNEIGFECRPIVAGNFANNEVVKYFDSENADDLETSNWVDKNGLFIGNNSFNMEEAFNSLKL